MNRIHVLAPELISQIAAGEVIERPASAVKELLENSLDAGASQISVEIEEGGLRRIRVVDNGAGMAAEDAVLAFERHATSKIRSLDDLFKLGTLGFRGEALASIASVARVELRTRKAENRVGTRVEMDGGKQLRVEELAVDKGTDITIWGLFQHTPARKKYMKSERTEYGHIFELVSQLALTRPDVGFRLQKDGTVAFDLAPGQSLKERVRQLYGGQTTQALIPVTYEQSNLLIRGFVGKPELSRSSKKYQFLFVNGRSIENRTVSKAVQEAFHSLLMHEKYPWFVLDLTLDPQFVDVNVHPRKLEVRFLNPQEVFRAVFGAVHHALQAPLLNPQFGERATIIPKRRSPDGMTQEVSKNQSLDLDEIRAPAPSRDFRPAETVNIKGLILRPVAQIARSYIVAESEEGLVLIDQHAAHERVRYSRFMEALKREKVLKQSLLTPLQLDLGADSIRLLNEFQSDFEALGFELEPFGGKTYLLRSVPIGLEKKDPERVAEELLAELTQEWKKNPVAGLQEALLTTAACRGAIKFGDALSMDEMEALLKDMSETEHCTHCPHGRPSLIQFSYGELETLFKRRNF